MEGKAVNVDALVIGGGPSGSAAATVLAAAGWDTVLVERSEFPRRKVCGEYLSWTNWASLRRLGVWEAFDQLAGPPVRRVALYGRNPDPCIGPLPKAPGDEPMPWGRALTRQRLDPLLLEQARRQGVRVLQPWCVTSLDREKQGWAVEVESADAKDSSAQRVTTSVVVLAHGSWSTFPWMPSVTKPPQPADLLGFKAHFTDAPLADDLMPLLAFPGGYGGMVCCEQGQVSLSCCIRRDTLATLRGAAATAGEAVFEHILSHVPAARELLRDADRPQPWLAAGPIRPGGRTLFDAGLFSVGNAAGEAHPVVAEGISMAIQSGLLAGVSLVDHVREDRTSVEAIEAAGVHYRKAWRQRFGRRVRVSAAIANLAMRPSIVRSAEPVVQRFPSLLNLGARLAGKSHSTGVEELR